jgi:hypothetical protein
MKITIETTEAHDAAFAELREQFMRSKGDLKLSLESFTVRWITESLDREAEATAAKVVAEKREEIRAKLDSMSAEELDTVKATLEVASAAKP